MDSTILRVLKTNKQNEIPQYETVLNLDGDQHFLSLVASLREISKNCLSIVLRKIISWRSHQMGQLSLLDVEKDQQKSLMGSFFSARKY
jgi:hypothetical protein